MSNHIFKEDAKIKGVLNIKRISETGEILDEKTIDNTIVTTGKYHIADQLSDRGESVMSHMAVGTGTTAPAIGDTALQSELARKVFDSKTQGTSTNANVVTYITTFAPGEGTGTLTEAGILNAASVGVLLCRTTFSAMTKGASDTIQLTWTVTYS